MKKIRLGKTELMVTKTSMGCLPVQRRTVEEGAALIRAAYEAGINFFDTANAYTDSEKKMGIALHDVRDKVILATKSGARTREGVLAHVENSRKMLQTDCIDILQLHNIQQVPDPNDPESDYAGAVEAKERGWIRHIGATSHRIDVAEKAVDSGLFETMQFPFSYISTDRDIALAERCRKADLGFIAMKGLAGGLLSNAKVCQAFMDQYDNVVAIWGVQHMWELEQWLALESAAPPMDQEALEVIRADREQLAGEFCRSCGYCMPCPVGIEIPTAGRMNMLLRRSPWQQYYTPEMREMMGRIDDCLGCRHCADRCPYGLDTPNLLKFMLQDWREYYEEHKDQ